jgi:ABC-type uncharacterized transport system involved in gliding motility auxiliary subunit
MAAVTDNLTYEFQDPETNPILAEKYDLTASGTLVFTRGEGEEEVFAKALSLNDRDIYSAMLQVVNPTEKKVYFLIGHGERSIDDFSPAGLQTAVSQAQDLGFTVEELNLLVQGAVPEDANALAIVDPQGPLQPEEVTAIGDYLASGGSLFLAREPIVDEGRARAEADNLNVMLLDQWGVIVEPDLIIEPALSLAGQDVPVSFVAIQYGASPVVPTDVQEFPLLFDIARSVSHQESPGVEFVDLVQTSVDAWGETNLAAFPPQPNPAEDNIGPISVGVTAEKSDVQARLVVFGDADFVSNNVVVQGGNGLVFTNALSWLARDELALELTPREVIQRQVVIPQEQLGLMQVVGICLGPTLMAIAGIVVWFSRRRRG